MGLQIDQDEFQTKSMHIVDVCLNFVSGAGILAESGLLEGLEYSDIPTDHCTVLVISPQIAVGCHSVLQ